MITGDFFASMRRLIAAVAAALVVSVPLHAADSLLLSRFADYLDSLRQQTGIPGLAAVIVGPSDISWDRGFGYSDVDKLVRTETFTPFQLDGVTQTVTAAIILRCVEHHRLSLDDRLPDGSASIRQILSHTTDAGAFSYQPQRLDLLKPIVESCDATGSFRGSIAQLLDRNVMWDSVPGPDAVGLPPTAAISQAQLDRYKSVLPRLAVPYAVDGQKRVSKSQYSVTGLAAASGLISTARDYARFDLALRNGTLLTDASLQAAWNPVNGKSGLGWFVQNYNGEKIVWAFGQSDNASSSLEITLTARATTLVLLANSDGLAKGFPLSSGDVTTSPFGKLFLELFVGNK